MSIRAAVTGAVVLTLALLSSSATRAEDDFEIELFRPRLELWAANVPDAEFKESTEKLGQRSFGLAANIPLGPTHVDGAGRIVGYQVFAELRAQTSPTEISFLSRDPDLSSGSLRVAGAMMSSGGNLYLVSLGASIAEDDETIDDPDARFSGVGLGTYRKSPGLMFVYGGAATYQYGRSLVLPLFGLNKKLGERWNLFTVIPFLVKTTWRASDAVSLHFGAAAAGERYRFANLGDFPGEPDILYLRLAQLRLSGELEWRATPGNSVLVEVGVNGARRLEFARSTERDDTVLEADLEPAGYAKLAWRIRFGKSLLEGADNAHP
jgi:hypothetical protein